MCAMLGPFQRTVVLNISEFPSTASRVDIAKCVNAKFASHFPVDSIQFVPGGNVQVTFRSDAAKRSVESADIIAIGSVQCRVVRPGPRMENVLVFHYPFESDPSALRRVLSSYGEVHDVSMQHYPDLNSVATGTRIVRMVRKSGIPRSVDIDGTLVKVWYRGQPVECDVCGKSGHVSKVCPLKGKCRRCLQPGHMARTCQNAPRAWDTVPSSGSSVVPLDPTPAEAAAASGASVPVRPSVDGVGDEMDFANEDDASADGDDAPSVCDEDSADVGLGESGVNGDVDVGEPEASQSVLVGVSTVVDPPVVSDCPPIDVVVKSKSNVAGSASAGVNVQCQSSMSGNEAGSASADVNVPVGEKSQVQCQSSVESLPDGQVVNTPLSSCLNVAPDSVAPWYEEKDLIDDTSADPSISCVPEGQVMTAIPGAEPDYPYCLVAKDYVLRRQPILAVDFPKKKIRIQRNKQSQWVDAYVRRRR